MRSLAVLCLLACAFATPSPSFATAPAGQAAADPPQARQVREKITVTATRLEESVEKVGSDVTIVSAEEIRASGAHWLIDVLERVPGLSLARTGGPGAVTSVFSRGTNSNQTLVLVNGIKANSPTTAAFDWAYLPAASVERIEVIRGPQSTLYGSDAIGGVINVITRAGSGPVQADLSVEAGSYASVRVHGGLQGSSGSSAGGFRYALGFDYFETDNFSAADQFAGNAERDGFRNRAIDGRAGRRFESGFDVEAFVQFNSGTSRFDGFDFARGPADALGATTDARSLLAGARTRYGAGIWSGDLMVSTSRGRLETANPGGFTVSSTIDTAITEIDFQNDLVFDADNTTVVGIEYRRERAASSDTNAFGADGYDASVHVLGSYAQHRLSIGDRINLSGGLRHEDHERFGGQTTYRLTGAWEASGGVRLHGSIGSGFRAPNFNELYLPGFGNSSLGPEKSRGWDLGAAGSWLDGRLDVDVTYFRNDLDSLIEFAFPAGFVNLGRATSLGWEVSLGAAPRRGVRLDASYTFTDAHATGSDLQLLRRPRHQAGLSATIGAGRRLTLFTELRHKGRRNDFGLADLIELPAYTVWNAAAQLRLTPDLRLLGRLDNLSDTHYQEVWGYGTPGRSAYLGFAYAPMFR